MTFDESLFELVCSTARRAALFHSAADALEWDERTGMPIAAGEYRAEQVSALRSAAHELRTNEKYGEHCRRPTTAAHSIRTGIRPPRFAGSIAISFVIESCPLIWFPN